MTAITIPLAPTVAPRVRHRRFEPEVYWRRRAMVLLFVVVGATGAHAALDALGGGPLTAAEAPSVAVIDLDTQPVARATYVVRSGDTLWSIARRIQPTGDVRPLVDQLAAERDGRPLQPGERITVP